MTPNPMDESAPTGCTTISIRLGTCHLFASSNLIFDPSRLSRLGVVLWLHHVHAGGPLAMLPFPLAASCTWQCGAKHFTKHVLGLG